MTPSPLTAYLAPENFLPELLRELKDVQSVHGNLVIAKGPAQPNVWAQNIWMDAQIFEFASISDAVKILRGEGKLWTHYSFDNHRRAQLIQDQLPALRDREMEFLGKLPEVPLGAWALLDKTTLLVGRKTNSPFPLGVIRFKEDKKIPPSRAYLKLWELFTVHGVRPQKGQRVVDFGSCPGGWTWVLQQMGCQVISIDRAPLDEKIARLPNIEFIKTNAFSLKPEDIGAIDWFFSDIICYPAKLYELVQQWQESGLCQNFVCTIKFQGETDFVSVQKFLEMKNCSVVHLYHNKHEVTALIRS